MANEVIGKNERNILVQVSKDTLEERGLYQDRFSGGFQPTSSPLSATGFDTKENAERVAQALNMLYQVTNQRYEVHVVKETVNREYLDTPPQKEEKVSTQEENREEDES